jgi:hypothetical protein
MGVIISWRISLPFYQYTPPKSYHSKNLTPKLLDALSEPGHRQERIIGISREQYLPVNKPINPSARNAGTARAHSTVVCSSRPVFRPQNLDGYVVDQTASQRES